MKDEILGHIPLRMSVLVSKFLKRATDKGKTVAGESEQTEVPDTGYKFLASIFFYGNTEMSLP